MKTNLPLKSFVAGALLLLSNLTFGQVIPNGPASEFALLTSVGAMQNLETYQYSKMLPDILEISNDSNTDFGYLNGDLKAGDEKSAKADPNDQIGCLGDSIAFIANSIKLGTLTYQWRKGNVNLINGGNIWGVTNDTLVINPIADVDGDSTYNVIVFSSIEPSDTSGYVSLTINTAPTITTQPIDQTECVGNAISFSVVAAGTSLTYQWRKGLVNLTNIDNLTGTTTDTLTLFPISTNDLASNYNVVINGTCTPPVTSTNVSLTVKTFPSITTVPANAVECAGSTAIFTVTAIGSDLTYQWRKGTVNLANTGNISGVLTNTLTLGSVTIADTSTNYNVVISGTCGADVISDAVSLVVNLSPFIIAQPSNKVECEGSLVNFSVLTTGSGLTYQWRKGLVNLTNTGNVTGATTATLTLDPVALIDAALDYNVVVTGTCLPSVVSANTFLTVNSATIITSQPSNQTECEGSSVNFSVGVTGTDLTYQWRKGLVSLTNTGNITGATTTTLTLNPANTSDISSDYNVVVSSACSSDLTSTYASLSLNSVVSISTQPTNQIACDGSSVSFAVEASGTGLTFQWRKGSVNLTNTGNISGVTTATLTIDPIGQSDAALNYNVVISGTCLPAITSANASLTVNSALAITTQPSNQIECDGNLASFSIEATGTNLSFQWRKGLVNLTNTGNVTGATTAAITLDPITISDEALNYNVVISSTCSADLTSNDVSLEINLSPTIITEPVDQSAMTNESASFTIEATGTALTYQWRKGTVNLHNSNRISGATSATLTINPIVAADAATIYNVVVSGLCAPSMTSANAALIITGEGPVITIEPVNAASCIGSTVVFSITTVGTNLTYQWRKGTVDLVNGSNVSGATSATLTINPVTILDEAINYNVVVSKSSEPIAISNYITLALNEIPIITSAPVTQTSCAGILSTFSVTATGTDLTYQWRKGTVDLVDGGNISGATTNTLTINPVTDADGATNYNVVVSGACLPNVTSGNVSLSINPVGIDQFVFGTTGNSIKVYPNPFTNSINIIINDELLTNMNGAYELAIYDAVGSLVKHTIIIEKVTTVETSDLKPGFYFYKVSDNEKLIQSGKLISK